MGDNSRKIRRKKPKLKFDKKMKTKLATLCMVIVLALFTLCGRIAYLNIVKGNEYSINVLAQQSFTSKTIPYKRGDIKDRNGNVLATSVMVYNLVIDSKVITDKQHDYFEPTVNALVKYFGADEDDIKTSIRERKDNSYWVYKKNLEYKDIEKFEKYMNYEYADTKEEKTDVANTKGIWFEKHYKRQYPYNTLACSVLGFSYADNSASLGIESSYGDYLRGVDGREYGYMDSENSMESVIKDAQNGNDVVSSIDMNIQRIVQKSINKYMKKYKPKRIAVVVADPNTGEILAMSDDVTFDLNDPTNLDKYYTKKQQETMAETDKGQKQLSKKLNEVWNNFCITDSYEPGSTAKPFTVAAAYEEGKVNKKTTFFCDGYEKVGGFKIKCHDVEGHGTLNVKGAIAHSCNDYMMFLGRQMGADMFAEYQTRFGFGAKTGIDLPLETRGIVYEKGEIGSSTLATNSFGQNFTVNMIQMVSAFSSLINGGYYYEPRVVKQILTEDGELVKNYSKNLIKQTVTRDTSNFIKECLRSVVTEGTGTTAAIPGYTVGGKTGTAEKVDTSGKGKGRIRGEYILSFLGTVPCENPKVVCYTLMDSPKDNTQATAYNTEMWTDIMKQVLPYLGIEKTEKVEKKAIKQSLETEFYENGIIEGDDGSLIYNKENE